MRQTKMTAKEWADLVFLIDSAAEEHPNIACLKLAAVFCRYFSAVRAIDRSMFHMKRNPDYSAETGPAAAPEGAELALEAALGSTRA